MSGQNDRRDAVPFDARHFEKLADQRPAVEKFRDIYAAHHWRGSESASGAGSGGEQTHVLRLELPRILQSLGAAAILDLPCGDYGWMRTVDLPVQQYIGADLLPELVARNRERYADARHAFLTLDLTRDPLPDADVLLCRDCLVHLSFADIAGAVANVKRSRIRWLLATTFPGAASNEDIVTGDWRPLNLERPPFSFPPPQQLINEHCTEADGTFADKSLALWRVASLPALATPGRVRGPGSS